MARYSVAFDVNGTVHRIQCESVKVGNQYLQCMGSTKNDDGAKLAFIPFDAVAYIVHDSITVSLAGEGDSATVAAQPEGDLTTATTTDT